MTEIKSDRIFYIKGYEMQSLLVTNCLIDLLGNNELKSLKQLPRNGFKAFDSESLKPLSRLAFEVF